MLATWDGAGSVRKEQPVETWSLTELADSQLAQARAASSGRSARMVYGGPATRMSQTVLALTAGQALAEHENPGEATVQVLRGRVRLTGGDTDAEGAAGELLRVPAARHALTALEDAVVLLTAVKS
jgi:quercetin dioxygenase-like cupin family protein